MTADPFIPADMILEIGVRRAISLIRRGRPDAARLALEVAIYGAATAIRGDACQN